MSRFMHAHDPLLGPPPMCWPRWTLRGSGRRTWSRDELELHFDGVRRWARTGELRLAWRRCARRAPVRLARRWRSPAATPRWRSPHSVREACGQTVARMPSLPKKLIDTAADLAGKAAESAPSRRSLRGEDDTSRPAAGRARAPSPVA